MRRTDREVKDRADILRIMGSCDVCRIALNNDGYPYIVPLNFGLQVEGDKITLIFHSALEGTKLDLIKRDNRASFEMDCSHKLQYSEEQGHCTMAYESVVGRGRIRLLEDGEKAAALQRIMDQYRKEGNSYFNPAAIGRTAVYCLEAEDITGKRNTPK